MSEINVIEQKYVPVKPKVLANEQIEVYLPTAGYNYPGLATFDTNGFIVDAKGKVKLRRNSVRNISTFTMDPITGKGTVYYDDGTVSEITFPVTTNNLYQRSNLMTVIEITPDAFVLDESTGNWLAAYSSAITGFTDDKFIVSYEQLGSHPYRTELDEDLKVRTGHYTINDTIFKGEDGSVVISLNSKITFRGRILLLGGAVFTDTQIVSINYNSSKRLFTVTKTDGSTEIINAVSETYLRDYVNQKMASVYTAKGNTSFDDLPTSEQLATGEYLGYVYNITDDFVADVRFDATAYGKSYSAGTNVVVIETSPGTYQFDVFGAMSGMVNLEDYISNKGGTIHGSLIFDGITEGVYSSVDANEIKLVNSSKSLTFDLNNITLYDMTTSTYKYIEYPSQSGRLIVDTDYATESTAGVSKVKDEFGTGISDGTMYLIPAFDNDIVTQSSANYRALMPRHTSKIVKVGITTNTETLTDAEKAAALAWLGVVKNIQDGTNNGAIQQVADGVADGFIFTGKNANATALDATLTGIISYGATGEFASAFGGKCAAIGKRSMAQGTTTIAKGKYSHAEGDNSVSLGDDSHAEGYMTVTGVSAQAAHAEGINTQALNKASHSEGEATKASGTHSHAEGTNTTASGSQAHAEGVNTKATGHYSHSEGYITTASGHKSHAEGDNTTADGEGAHAEGALCAANGNASHAGGSGAIANGTYSFAHGNKVIAGQHNQSVFGRFNDNNPANIFEIGNGENDDHRSNAFEVRYNGEAYAGGKKLLREGEASGGGGGTKLYLHSINSGVFIVTTRQQPFTTVYELWSTCPNEWGNPVHSGFVNMYYWGGPTYFLFKDGDTSNPTVIGAGPYDIEEGFTDTVTEL